MKILLALDNSPYSEAASEEVITELRPAGTEVHVVSVVDTGRLLPHEDGFGVHAMFVEEVSALMEEWRNEAKETVNEATRKLSSAGFTTKSIVMEGDVKPCILDYAEEWKPDLIVMGSQGKNAFERFLLGSVSDGILRHAKCSVRVVRIAALAKDASATQTKQGDAAHSVQGKAA